MRIRQVRNIRWILIGVIAGVLLAVGFDYYQTWRQRAGLMRKTPRMLGEEMLRAAEAIEYADYRNGILQFNIRAEKLLETREGINILQGLEAEDYDPDGSIRNRIRSRRGEYDRANRRVLFSEDVQILLGSEAEMRTGSLQYDLTGDVGYTEDLVELKMRNASGTSRGVRYLGGEKSIELISDIDLSFVPPPPEDAASPSTEPVRVRAQRAYYSEPHGEVRFSGSARVEASSGDLSGERIIARLDSSSRQLASVVCEGDAVYRSAAQHAASTLSGRRITVSLHPGSSTAERVLVEKDARFGVMAAGQGQELAAEQIQLELGGRPEGPRRLIGKGGVQYTLRKASGLTAAGGEMLQATFRQGGSELKDLRITGDARLAVEDSGSHSREELVASEIRVSFDEREEKSGLRELKAERAVRWRSLPGLNEKTGKRVGGYSMNADSLHLSYAEAGAFLESGRAAGDVVLTAIPGEQEANAGLRRLRCDRVRLTFFPELNRIRLFEGEGRVEGLYQKNRHGGGQEEFLSYRTFSSAVRAAFDEKDGTLSSASQWGNFIYRDDERRVTAGRADYSAGHELLVLRESPRVTDASGITSGNQFEYHLRDQLLHVTGRVQSILHAGRSGRVGFGEAGSADVPESVITASEMRYWMDESRALYSGGIKLFSAEGQLQAGSLSLAGAGDEIEARGGVHHILFMQEAVPRPRMERKEPESAARAEADPLTIRSDTLRYTRSSNTIHYGGGVRLESSQTLISSQELDAVLDATGRRIEFATARGELRIAQEGREAEGDEALYYPSEGRFIVMGRPATIRDPKRGDSAARRLTFYTSNDRILLENRRQHQP